MLEGDIVLWADPFAAAAAEAPAGAWPLSLRNRSAVAKRVLAEQEARGARTSVLVLAAAGDEPGEFPVASIVTAGAIIEVLSDLGLDHTSPEAATALGAWLGVKPAVKHLLGASATARALKAAGQEAQVAAALEVDADS